jgi:hypothetical protein
MVHPDGERGAVKHALQYFQGLELGLELATPSAAEMTLDPTSPRPTFDIVTGLANEAYDQELVTALTTIVQETKKLKTAYEANNAEALYKAVGEALEKASFGAVRCIDIIFIIFVCFYFFIFFWAAQIKTSLGGTLKGMEEKKLIFKRPHNLNGVLYPVLFEEGGEYYPGNTAYSGVVYSVHVCSGFLNDRSRNVTFFFSL